MKYVLEYVDVNKQKPVQGRVDDIEEHILEIADTFVNDDFNEECFLFDYERRTLGAKFITHKVFRHDDKVVHKLYYNLRLHPIQVEAAKHPRPQR